MCESPLDTTIYNLICKIDLDWSTWLNLAKKCAKYEKIMKYYEIKDIVNKHYTSLLLRLLEGYVNHDLQKYYTFPEFCEYVSQQVIIQGYEEVYDYIRDLSRYLEYADRRAIVPNLYTTNLKKDHDLISCKIPRAAFI